MEKDLTVSERMIDAWHDGAGDTDLIEYLGLTWEQYEKVVLDPEKLDEAVRNAMADLREIHTDYTDRNDEHRMYCQGCQNPWPCPDGIRAWSAVDPDEFPLM